MDAKPARWLIVVLAIIAILLIVIIVVLLAGDDDPAAAPTHLAGMRCLADGFLTTSATTADGTTREYTETTYAWVPGPGEFQALLLSIHVLTSPADDAVIFSAADLDCPPGP